MDNKRYMRLAAVVLLAALGQGAMAQLNPLGSQYYNNQYIVNPAFAGEGRGLKVNAAYRKLWSGIPGSPLTQNVTVDYGLGKVGLGLNVNNESSGLLRQTRAVASYAYHLPLDSGRNHLSFGLSLGMMSQRVQEQDLGQSRRHRRWGVQRAADLPRRGLRCGLRIGADRTGLDSQPEELLQEGRGEAGRHRDLLHRGGLCLPAGGRHGAGAQGGLQGGEELRQHGGRRHTAVPLPEALHAHGHVPQQPERHLRAGHGHRQKVPGIGHVHHTDLKAQRIHQRQLRTQPQG